MKKIFTFIEPKKGIRTKEIIVIVLLILISTIMIINCLKSITYQTNKLTYVDSKVMKTDLSLYDYCEDDNVCPVTYFNDSISLTINYSFTEYHDLNTNIVIGYFYSTDDNTLVVFDNNEPSLKEKKNALIDTYSKTIVPALNFAISGVIIAIGILIILFFSKAFSKYEKIWFISILILASIFSCLFPEESANGINGIIIMLLYLVDTFLNVLCELLISKQSRFNFLVSILVEITEILICIVLMYRFATMASTLFFWLPIDIISFINWSKHKDEQEDDLTIVRRLKGYQEILIIFGIIVWTLVVGYLLSGLDIASDFIKNKSIETLIVYLDACASAVGIANGMFIFFRLREQWIAWYICAILETVMNILAGQYVLLILKLGYFTNTTYGYIKWSKYIKNHKEDKSTLF